MTGIGALLAAIAAVFAAILGFVCYPVKKLIKSIRKKDLEEAQTPDKPESPSGS